MPRKKVNIAIPKLKEHADKVLEDLGVNCSPEEFIQEYKKQFAEEYAKYENGWKRVILEQKSGKGTPPAPETYLKLAYNNAIARYKKTKIARAE